MRVEVPIPMVDPNIVPPILEPGVIPIPMEAAYTPKQRQWWLRVYTNKWGFPQCAFPMYTEATGFIRCAYTHPQGKGIEIHHILPNLWVKKQQPWADPNDIQTTLAIATCKRHHHYEPHETVFTELRGHWKEKEVVEQVFRDQREMAERGEVFWDAEWDQVLVEIAGAAVQQYMRVHPNDPYPIDNSWAKKVHPKKVHWYDGLF